ncbi:hypothetical protein CF15_06125 [Pyrodictium occultum]|uniref:Carbohydrate kinase PfkB domain-containing protein n=1 Tax=Pyrodictium occultum TaxID=2309 RepID=A0A0V8RW87_PYROC|nr:PfkB family carbohydrate kinase [Pyrodictium occultum]KSW12318.1 hypothetical protein CF15_06125 [Pyrodictium occultum]
MLVIDVYSSPTLDVIEDRLCRGGPAYYAQLALHAIGAADARVRLALPTCIDAEWYLDADWCPGSVHAEGYECATVFAVKEGHGGRRLRVLREPDPLEPDPRGDAALVSPVLGELEPAEAARLLTHYRLAIVDVQGFGRVNGGGEVEAFSRGVLAFLEQPAEPGGFAAVKLSLEDVAGAAWAAEAVRLHRHAPYSALLVTAGPRGALAVLGDGSALAVRPRRVEAVSTGAGDMLSVLTLYGLWKGWDLEDAVAGAAAAVACILLERSRRGRVEEGACKASFMGRRGVSVEKLPGGCSSADCIVMAFEQG